MSAFISTASVDEICILSDGATYKNDGTITDIGCKIAVAEKVPFAVTVRGSKFLGDKIKQFMCDFADKAGVDIAIEGLKAGIPEMLSNPEFNGLDYVHLHVAAFSPTKGLVRYSFHNLPQPFADGEKPMMLNEVGGTYSAGNVCTMAEYAAAGVTPRRQGETLSTFARRNGAAMFDAMRKKPMVLLENDAHGGRQYLIGGQCDLMVLTKAGATVETLRTWPEDRIGEKIAPLRESPVVGLNRHQRRAANSNKQAA